MGSRLSKQELLEGLFKALYEDGWSEAGETPTQTFRTHSFAFGGGPLAHTGGRHRFKKGELSMTVGINTLCIYRKPEEPETIAGQGRLAGRRVFTFADWPMTNIQITRGDLENLPQLLIEIEEAVGKLKE